MGNNIGMGKIEERGKWVKVKGEKLHKNRVNCQEKQMFFSGVISKISQCLVYTPVFILIHFHFLSSYLGYVLARIKIVFIEKSQLSLRTSIFASLNIFSS